MKEVRLFLLIFSLLFLKPDILTGAEGDVLWMKIHYGWFSSFCSVVVDKDDNIIAGGHFYNGTNTDYRVAKYNSDGNFLWMRVYDNGDEFGNSVAVDDTGNVIITGEFNNGTNYDYLTIKYSSNGDTLWTRIYDGGSDDKAYGVSTDSLGNVYVTGCCTAAYSPTTDFLSIKYDSNGNTEWVRFYDSGGNESAQGIVVDNNYIYVTGYTTISNYGYCLTIKYDLDGNTQWIKVSEKKDSMGRDIVADASNNIIIAARYFKKFIGFMNYFTVKYDSSGNTLWDQIYDVGIWEEAYGVSVDAYGNIFVTGQYRNANYDCLTLKYNPAGNLLWRHFYDIRSVDIANDIAVDASGNFIIVGFGGDSVTFIMKCEGAPNMGITYPEVQGEVKIGSTGGQGIVYANKNEQAVIAFKPTSVGKVTVRIYTLNGLLIWQDSKEIANPDDPSNYIQWACDNTEGGQVASGIYIVYVEGPGIKVTKKVAILR